MTEYALHCSTMYSLKQSSTSKLNDYIVLSHSRHTANARNLLKRNADGVTSLLLTRNKFIHEPVEKTDDLNRMPLIKIHTNVLCAFYLGCA